MPKSTISRPLLPVEYLHECFHYCPETGVLTWKERPREHFNSAGAHTRFLSSWAGKPAGCLTPRGYLLARINGDGYLVHRIAWAISYGVWPEKWLDHINLVRGDNRIANLSEADSTTNSLRHVRRPDNVSGVTGVTWDQKAGKWAAQVRFRGVQYSLGLYNELADAAAAREAANLRFGFSENHGQENPNKVSDALPGRLRKNNASGHLGVSYRKRSGRWEAHIGFLGKQVCLGAFNTKEEAVAARKAAEIKHGVAGRVLYGRGAIIKNSPT